MKTLTPLLLAILGGCASSPAASSLYFPELAQRARHFDPTALPQILALSETTPPGEQLEELAELAAAYVIHSPKVFLEAQSGQAGCFGVSFLGARFVDDQPSRKAELAARRDALLDVADPGLVAVRARCLAALHGS